MMYYIATINGVEYAITGTRDEYTAFPLTDDNPNKPAYDAWLEAGNTPEPWENQ